MTGGKKSWGETVLGWFVVRGENDPDVGEASRGPTDTALPPPAVEPIGELPTASGGVVDFDAVFAAFGIDTEARDRLSKADGLLESLPAGAEAGVKRQIVAASLKAFGVPFEQIIETACEEIQALDAYQRKGGAALQAFCDEAERRIAGLEQEIQSARMAMEKEAGDHKKML
ncbi:MAG TPA: hypothetical protein VFT43_11620, partial [Candidatus Polarisedimenticolia bacterium]|nr:hypothetical protein [Candidatus Polarisedimenticolia bacterium]